MTATLEAGATMYPIAMTGRNRASFANSPRKLSPRPKMTLGRKIVQSRPERWTTASPCPLLRR